MTVPVTVSEARAALPRLLDRVEAGEEIEVTRHGRVVAVLVRPDTLPPSKNACSGRATEPGATRTRSPRRGRSSSSPRSTPIGRGRRVDAFHADALIYACVPDHPLGEPVRALFRGSRSEQVGIGSALLIPELLNKPCRKGASCARAAPRPVGVVRRRPVHRRAGGGTWSRVRTTSCRCHASRYCGQRRRRPIHHEQQT
jgi:antitoxin (DNA-binding transcriptional repressor) of toxin-antitoxin stability system